MLNRSTFFYFAAILLFFSTIFPSYSQIVEQWKSLPIRSQVEYNNGAIGGEGEQFLHGFSRCLTQPNFVYAGQDVAGTWKSVDGGVTWSKTKDRGLYITQSQSIEVDPVDPNIVMMAVENTNGNVKANPYQGVYRSKDGGETWQLVLNSPHVVQRKVRHLVAYSLPSMSSKTSSPTRWYAADSASLWRSDMSGESASWSKVFTFTGGLTINEVIAHPTSLDTVYVTTQTGLYRSTDGGANMSAIAAFSGMKVSTVLMNAKLPKKVYVVVSGGGLYLSIDNGATFVKQTVKVGTKDYSTSVHRGAINPGFPEQIYLIGVDNAKLSWVTNDGTVTWKSLPVATTFPGLHREAGWRRWIDGIMGEICPNPLDKNQAAATARSSFFQITGAGSSVSESSTGFTGNAAMQTDQSIAFHPYTPGVFGIFCFDIGPRMTSTDGDWFHEPDLAINNWRWVSNPRLVEWTGSYSAAFQPVKDSKILVASVGKYLSTNQLMRSVDNGLTWGAAPITPNTTAAMQAFNFIGFDRYSPNVVYSGNLKSVDAGLTYSTIPFPAAYTVNSVFPVVCGVSNDTLKMKSYIFALDGSRQKILRSEDQGLTWILLYNLNSVSSYATFVDSNPTISVHPYNPNIVYTLDKNRDLLKITYNPTTKLGSPSNLNVFKSLPSWVPAGVRSFNQVRRIGIDPVNPNYIYVSMLTPGFPNVYRSTDAGKTWASISDDLTHKGGCLIVNPHTRELYRGSMVGTMVFPAPTTAILPVFESKKLCAYVDNSSKNLMVLGGNEGENFEILDVTGKAISRFSGKQQSVSTLASGIYILSAKNRVPIKFIKK